MIPNIWTPWNIQTARNDSNLSLINKMGGHSAHFSRSMRRVFPSIALFFLFFLSCNGEPDYRGARLHPIHFRPQIQTSGDGECLQCHSEILKNSVLERTPSGLSGKELRSWYQNTSTYEGGQSTFHVRHLTGPLAKRILNFQCKDCHLGSDPFNEADVPKKGDFTLRKSVNVQETCLKCHGTFPYEKMNLSGNWESVKESVGGNCLVCHSGIRTDRHNADYLQKEEIEKAAKENPDVCYGCHGGRAWYRISYDYE